MPNRCKSWSRIPFPYAWLYLPKYSPRIFINHLVADINSQPKLMPIILPEDYKDIAQFKRLLLYQIFIATMLEILVVLLNTSMVCHIISCRC